MDKLEELAREVNEEAQVHVKWKTIGECCTLLNDKRKSITNENRIHGDTPYYGANGVIDTVEGHLLDGEFILIGARGSVQQDGRPVINWASGKIWPSTTCHVLGAADGIHLRWLYHQLHTVDVTGIIRGSTIPGIQADDLMRIKIPVPHIYDQIALAMALDLIHNKLIDEPKRLKEIEDTKEHGEEVKQLCFDALEEAKNNG